MLRDEERVRIVQALGVWLEGHPEPDAAVFGIAAYPASLTPRQLVISVQENDEVGQGVLAILEYSIRRTSLERVARDFESFGPHQPREVRFGG